MIHIPVLKDDVIKALDVKPGKKYIDATLGAGGHATEIVARGGTLLGIDQDSIAVRGDWKQAQGNFRNIENIAKEHGFTMVSGILFDLGVSSMQLDTANRGFSYRFPDALLDLRMNQQAGERASEYINRASEEELYDVFSTYGEEQLARELAHSIIGARKIKSIETVGDLIAVVGSVVANEQSKFSVLSRVFQALRIVINDEIASLKEGLEGARSLLEPGGILAVISFHSLEDRIVKQFMKTEYWNMLTKHPIVPNETEIYLNKRSRSAKLRVAQKR